jgi:hypothetical protein
MQTLPPVPFIDVRDGGPLEHARVRRRAMEELRAACLEFFPAARLWLPLADRIAKSWLQRSQSPYVSEVAAIAAVSGAPGVYLINTSYEWGCTAACHGAGPPHLVRTLDWPFAGMGKGLEVALQAGPAGEFFNVTWPGAVGVLTAMAPGRFAATINQAPVRRRTRTPWLRWIDYGLNAIATWSGIRYAPPAHVLRQVFETAPDYAAAKRQLTSRPMARPVLIALIGTRPEESCLIERTETEARVREGPFTVANDWQEPQTGWEPRACGGPVEIDSRNRHTALSASVGRIASPFDWLRPPVHNWATRVAVEMSPGEGVLRAMGLEPAGKDVPSAPATQVFDLAAMRGAVLHAQ